MISVRARAHRVRVGQSVILARSVPRSLEHLLEGQPFANCQLAGFATATQTHFRARSPGRDRPVLSSKMLAYRADRAGRFRGRAGNMFFMVLGVLFFAFVV